eukprot:721901-Rhodomonas_salina.2
MISGPSLGESTVIVTRQRCYLSRRADFTASVRPGDLRVGFKAKALMLVDWGREALSRLALPKHIAKHPEEGEDQPRDADDDREQGSADVHPELRPATVLDNRRDAAPDRRKTAHDEDGHECEATEVAHASPAV